MSVSRSITSEAGPERVPSRNLNGISGSLIGSGAGLVGFLGAEYGLVKNVVDGFSAFRRGGSPSLPGGTVQSNLIW